MAGLEISPVANTTVVSAAWNGDRRTCAPPFVTLTPPRASTRIGEGLISARETSCVAVGQQVAGP